MKIAVNTRFLLKDKLEGIGIYTQEIFKRVVRLLPEHEFYFLFDRKWDSEFIFEKNVTPVIVSPYARHPFLWYWWFERAVPKALKKINADLFISPDGYGSLHTEIPQIVTVHDLAFEHYKDHTPFLVSNYYQYFGPAYCKKADKILAVSEFTKLDIVTRYKIESTKIEVVYNGFDNTCMSKEKREKNEQPYFIFIGAVHPRKNVLGLLKAFETFRESNIPEHRLVIIGRKAWMNKEMEDYFRQMKFIKDVTWIEKTGRKNLLSLLQNARALVYPSYFEGFGIPIIEAMSLGVPVITSNVSSMPEVAGNAALLVDPRNTASIAQAMQDIAINENLRKELIEKGKLRAAHFNWDFSAKKVVEIIRSYQK